MNINKDSFIRLVKLYNYITLSLYVVFTLATDSAELGLEIKDTSSILAHTKKIQLRNISNYQMIIKERS